MADFMKAFSSFSSHKRKRSATDVVVAGISEPEWKKRTTSLPFRSPSQPKSAPIFPPSNPTWTSFHGTLTPVDTSEDESVGNENDVFSSNHPPSLTDSQTSTDSNSTSSVRVQVDTQDQDQDMEISMSSPTRPRMGRLRSNDLMSRPNFLSPDSSHAPSHDRIPTPITSHFDPRHIQLTSNPRHSFPPLRTNLSPTVEQETWALGPDGLPSPTDYSPQIYDSDAMMSGLQLNCDDDETMMPNQMQSNEDNRSNYGLNLDGQPSRGHSHQRQASSRSARLHMGYLAGCEKCAQKVPGHYSHILWS